MSRSWCALARAGEKRPFDATHLGRCAAEEEDAIRSFGALSAKQRGDIAVQHGLAAKALESEVTHKVESSISRFSACIVISKANIRHWPNTESLSMRTISHGTLTLVANAEDETVCLLRGNVPIVAYHVSHIWSACPHLSSLPSIQLPSDQVMEFLNQIMRTEAQSKNYDLSSSMRHISLMPAPATTVSAEDIFAVIGANHHLLSQLRTLTVAGEFNEETELGELSSFFQRAKFLEVLGLPHTKFSRISESFLPLLRDTMIRVADFEGNDLGLTKDVDDSVPLLAEYIKFNKFLMELNLNNNNLSGSSAQTLLEALVKSDTRLYPEDLTKELFGAEEEEDAYGCDLESVSFFLPHEDDDEEEDIEEEEEDEGEDGNPWGGSEKNGDDASTSEARKSPRSFIVDEDANNGIEEEEDYEEAGEVGGEDLEEQVEEYEGEEEEEEGEEKEAAERREFLRRIEKKFNRLRRMLLEKEKTERRSCVLNHVQEAGVLLEELGLIREELAEEKRISIEKYCWRRSGWSHLQVLRLRGNPIGNEGAKALASALRHEMDLEDEEVERIQKDLSSAADRLVNQLVKGYQRTMIEEARGRDRIVAERGQVFNSLTTVTLHNPVQGVNNGLGEEDEEINVLYMGGDNEGGVNDITHGSEGQYGLSGEVTPVPYVDVLGDAGRSSLEEEVALLLEVCGKWTIRVERRKRCVPYLRLLDLGSCGIGSSGLKFIGNVLAENKSLEALLLRRNIFGRKQMKVPVDDDDSRSEEERPADRVDVPLYVSPGCISLFTALKTNRTLKVLDLGYNNMYPATIRVLAEALHENTTLTSLSLEGNRIGYGGSAAEAAQVAVECVRMEDDGGKHSCFLELLLAISKGNITTLLLGYNDLSQCWGDEEVKALASVCNRLEVLHLAGNQLGSEDIMKWANAGGADFTLKELHLTRNSLRGPEGGVALSGILRRCKGTLQDLFLDQNPLGTLGVAEAFMSHELPFLRLLSIRNAEVTQACAFPASSLTSLQHLLISDNPFTATELLNVADLLRSNARNLGSLSLWSRVFDMETIIPELREIVRHMPRLLFADFGVLLRFDGVLDAQDAFGQMEATFTARRMEQFFSTLPTELK